MAEAKATLMLRAAGQAVARQAEAEWFGSPFHRFFLARPKTQGFALRPRDSRPADPARGRQILAGTFRLGGATLELGPEGDPFDRPSPTRPFAVALHRFGWLPDLVAAGDDGVRRALALQADWRRSFGRWNGFSWSGETLERRVFNLACAASVLAGPAADAEITQLAEDLARQARHLLDITRDPARAAERAAVAALAGCALAETAGDKLTNEAMHRLERLLPKAVLADGVHASRCPETGMELLFDLLALDDALAQRGRAASEVLQQAIDRLTTATRFFTLADGRLAGFQGGETSDAGRVAAALLRADAERAVPTGMAEGGYQRLIGRDLQVIVDAAAPPHGAYAVTACAQPLALEVVCGRERLVTGCGWSTGRGAPQAFRRVEAASTAAPVDGSAGEPLDGLMANILGPVLIGAPASVVAQRHDTETGGFLELSHDGFVAATGLRHSRKLFMDAAADELRGEDLFEPASEAPTVHTPFVVRFHLHPDARASVARDNKSVLIKPSPTSAGWWLRNDAPEVALESSTHFEHGEARPCSQIVLRGQARPGKGGRIRWKLTQAES